MDPLNLCACVTEKARAIRHACTACSTEKAKREGVARTIRWYRERGWLAR